MEDNYKIQNNSEQVKIINNKNSYYNKKQGNRGGYKKGGVIFLINIV